MEEQIDKQSDKQQRDELAKLQQEVKPANKKVIIVNFLLIMMIFVGLFIYMLKVDGIDNIIQLIHQVDNKWVIAGLICLMIHWFCEASNLHIPLKKMYPNQTFSH